MLPKEVRNFFIFGIPNMTSTGMEKTSVNLVALNQSPGRFEVSKTVTDDSLSISLAIVKPDIPAPITAILLNLFIVVQTDF